MSFTNPIIACACMDEAASLLRNCPRYEEQLGFLFSAYEPAYYWFEVWEMVRRSHAPTPTCVHMFRLMLPRSPLAHMAA